MPYAPPRSPCCRHIGARRGDRKSTRLNSSHLVISYAVFCLKKKKTKYFSSRLSPGGSGSVATRPASFAPLLVLPPRLRLFAHRCELILAAREHCCGVRDLGR